MFIFASDKSKCFFYWKVPKLLLLAVNRDDSKKRRLIFATFASDKSQWWHVFATFASNKSQWWHVFATFASEKSQWLQLFATFASDKSQWLQQFFSNTLLRIATTGLRRQSDRKWNLHHFTKSHKLILEIFLPMIWQIDIQETISHSYFPS